MDKDALSKVGAIALNAVFGDKPQVALQIARTLGSAEAVFSLSRKELTDVFGPYGKYPDLIGPACLEKAEREYLGLKSKGYGFVSILDEYYPPLLRDCPDAPVMLYIRSATPVESLFAGRRAFAVVGTRDMSPYGRDWCTRIVADMAGYGTRPAIVSGLAIGVDATAHLAALEHGLPTIAVSPVGIDGTYPKRHEGLASRIASSPGGAIITDYPPGTLPMPYNFLRRNRIIAGLGDAALLVESRVRGGGMMTARLASGYGRSVYALPGRIEDPRSGGCNLLLWEKVAEPIASLDTLRAALDPEGRRRGKRPDMESAVRERFGEQGREAGLLLGICRTVRENGGIDYGGLCEALGASYSEIARCAGLLESEGFIRSDIFQRCSINVKFA